jgi:protein-S-isoprenylcysteine O-methyltransferase Ste14
LKSPTAKEVWQLVAKRVRVPLGFLFAGIYFWFARPSTHSLLASLVLVIPGIALRACASGHVKKNAELTTTGPYAYTRNPLYLGSMLIAFGFAAASRSLGISIALAVLFAMIYWPTIQSEEKYLRAHFSTFDAYAQQVPRLLPFRFLRARKGNSQTQSNFSWALYMKHREYNSVLGSSILFLALIARMVWKH